MTLLTPMTQAIPADCEPIDFLAPWTRRAELGERFDVAGAVVGSERTRARFDGKTLTIEHWLGRVPVALLELRQAGSGDWRARASSQGGILGSMATESAGVSACQDLRDAFARAEPAQPVAWAQRLMWASGWTPYGASPR